MSLGVEQSIANQVHLLMRSLGMHSEEDILVHGEDGPYGLIGWQHQQRRDFKSLVNGLSAAIVAGSSSMRLWPRVSPGGDVN